MTPGEVLRARVCVIGSGCAGLNCLDALLQMGETDAVLVTEGMNMGTSRNAGSDKQTYYKLSLSASQADCALDMARDLVSEGVNGDTALCEAAGSLESFFKLAYLGVPFPQTEMGAYAGYQTDHDPRRRATSAGPLTSKYMTERLEASVRARGARIIDGATAFRLLIEGGRVEGVYLYVGGRVKLLRAPYVVLATGGPASVYAQSVYPESQSGMSSLALEAGAEMANLHQWQYGLASVAFRWNVSGTYQQVMPKYVSVDKAGISREFGPETLDNRFLKGYQWPFDVRKIGASSGIDLLVQREINLGRRVYLDFRSNPEGFKKLGAEGRAYLDASGATQDTPYARLVHMNPGAAELYLSHGIDLSRETLEIAVCAQHMNGGVAVDANWESSIPGLYAAGEAAGTFGAYRPGGSALNATQVGSLRAARHIHYAGKREPTSGNADFETPLAPDPALDAECARDMSMYGAHLRDLNQLESLDRRMRDAAYAPRAGDLRPYLKARDAMQTRRAVISAIRAAAEAYGSTGAGLTLDENGEWDVPALGARARGHIDRAENLVLITRKAGDGYETFTRPARPIPEEDEWFENVWRAWKARTGVETR